MSFIDLFTYFIDLFIYLGVQRDEVERLVDSVQLSTLKDKRFNILLEFDNKTEAPPPDRYLGVELQAPRDVTDLSRTSSNTARGTNT